MAKFKFPQNPNADRTNPFEDGQGANPFGDAAAPANDPGNPEAADNSEAAGSNPYAAAESSSVQPYRPGDFETFLPNRGVWVWWLGLIGCCIQLVAIVVAVVAMVSVGDFLGGLVYGLPGQLIGLALSVPAWIMGQVDAKAIAAGAMEDGGRRATWCGLRLGVIGTLLGVSQLFLYFGLLLFVEFYA
jgi:hypothetical protein